MFARLIKIGFLAFFCLHIFLVINIFSVNAMSINNTGLTETTNIGYGGTPPIGGGTEEDLASVAGKIVGAALSFIGILFFGLVIYGGFLWMLARGNSGEIDKAKDLIIAATTGLIIVLSAYALTRFFADVIFAPN
jgi:cbb3-type cytochrome oxidase subunit 3